MSSIFTKIIDGEIPARFVWADDQVVAFLDAGPLTDGHTLVVPRKEVDHWMDADDELSARLYTVARIIASAQRLEFGSERVGLMVQGFEVPHLHLHVWPANGPADFNLANANKNPDPKQLDDNAARLRAALVAAGHGEAVPDADE
ncbi:HIT family protein [Saxibacter everestensis]|uniref:HIT family protein n=1 Tax=Saxibacter everestensis TaxID=2909229 RepID=A0ABY8QY92_9MICO|nr:HIT family protein [Brevibacteriaceae bacterium ZFBP1038]